MLTCAGAGRLVQGRVKMELFDRKRAMDYLTAALAMSEKLQVHTRSPPDAPMWPSGHIGSHRVTSGHIGCHLVTCWSHLITFGRISDIGHIGHISDIW
eukprot:8171749-Pyramimonas_sp.AAC.1